MNFRKRDWQAFTAWFLTIVLLAGSFGIYTYLYVEQRKQYFVEKKLRNLLLLGDQVKLRVENIANDVLPNAARNYFNLECSNAKAPAQSTLKVYDATGPSPRPPSNQEACGYSAVLAKTQLVENFKLNDSISLGPPPKAWSPVSLASVIVSTEGADPNLIFTYRSPPTIGSTSLPEWQGHIAAQNLFGQFARESFDQIAVVTPTGEVLFQIGSTRLGISNVRPLVERSELLAQPAAKDAKPDDIRPGSAFASAIDSASVTTVKLAGEDYLLFFQPVNIRLTGGAPEQLGHFEKLDWRIVGILSKARFTRDSSTFSYNTILLFLFFLLLMIFIGPFIKIASLGEKDSLSKWDVIFLFVSAVLTSALITFFAADAYAFTQVEINADSQLTELGNRVQTNFDNELNKLLSLLVEVSQKPAPGPEFSTLVNLLGDQELPTPQDKSRNAPLPPTPGELKANFLKGAYFDRFVWIDPSGQQKRKWTIYDTTTSLLPVAERPYFQSVRDNTYLSRKSTSPSGQTVCFWLGPILSRNTGENLVTLSVRGPAAKAEPLTPQPQSSPSLPSNCDWHADQPAHWVVAVDAIFPSLRNVTLPPGYGFALLHRDGSVLFHSDSKRHLNENFLEESDQNPRLRGAIFGRSGEFFNVYYLGTSHRLHTVPFDAPRWTLVVFYDKHYLHTTNVEILATTLLLFLVFLASQFPAIALLWFRRPQWLWFNTNCEGTYFPFLLGVLLSILVFLAGLLFLTPIANVFAAFLFPFVLLSATYFRFRHSRGYTDTVRENEKAETASYILSFVPPVFCLSAMFYCCQTEGESWQAILLIVLAGLILGCVFWKGAKQSPSLPENPTEAGKQRLRFCPPELAYKLSIAGLLVVLGILPALAFFRAAYRNEMLLLLKHGSYRLDQSLFAREQRLRKESHNIYGADAYLRARQSHIAPPNPDPPPGPQDSPDPLDVYRDFFFKCPGSKAVDLSATSVTPFERWLKVGRAQLLFDPIVAESQGLLRDFPPDADDPPANWFGINNSCVRFPQYSAASVPGAVEVPAAWQFSSPRWIFISFLIAMGVLFIVSRMVSFITGRIFLIHFKSPEGADPPPALRDFDNVWIACKPHQKIALWDFASDGFVNSRNPAIPELVQKGLLTLHPLQFKNPEYRKLIKAKKDDEALVPNKDETLSLWHLLKWPLVVALLALTAFLFFSQRKIFEGGAGFLGALTAAVASFFNLFDQFRGAKR